MHKEVHIYYLFKNLTPKSILQYFQFYFIFFNSIFVNNVHHNKSFKSTRKLITILFFGIKSFYFTYGFILMFVLHNIFCMPM